jgi:hypothetical protein
MLEIVVLAARLEPRSRDMPAIDDTMPKPGTPPRRTSEEDLEGFDESQRAELVETLGGVQAGGNLVTDIKRDTGDDPYDAPGEELDSVASSKDDTDQAAGEDDA